MTRITRTTVMGTDGVIHNEHVGNVLANTNWAELSRQKLALMKTCEDNPCHPLTGLLHFIDAVQDAADKDGYPVVWWITTEDK